MREKLLYFYLGPRQRAQVTAREPKILTRIVGVVEAAGWQVVLLPEEARHAAPQIDGYHLVLNQAVPSGLGPETVCLSLRRCYMEPFWRIEAVNDRWAWEIARLPFDARAVRAPYVQAFFDRWQKNLFEGKPITRDGFVFVPLQGKLLRHRQFQSMSPMAMLDVVLAHEMRPVIATLHPAETYDAEDMDALHELAGQHARFTLSTELSIDLLRRCDGVVTQNSSLALIGYFARKPAVLFAEADFHHIAGSVPRDGVGRALMHRGHDVPYAPYLYWFFKMNAITGWSDDVHRQIAERLRQHGWQV